MTTGTARTVIIALALTAVSGCGNDGDTAAPTTTRPEATTTTTITEQPAGTTVDLSAIEGPEEWVAVVVDVYQRMHALKTNPDTERVALVFSESCPCYEDERDTVRFLVDEGLRLDADPPAVLRVDVADERPGRVRLTVTTQAQPGRLVDADGEVVQEIEAPPPGRASIVLVADGEGGSHRVFDFQELDQ